MNYKHLYPDGFVPTREYVDWLYNEANRMFEVYTAAFHDYFKHKTPCIDDYKHVQLLGEFAQIMHDAYRKASDDWINQPAFDWMKEGDDDAVL